MLKRTLPFLLLLALLGPGARAEVVDRIVAVVGNEAITERELNHAFETDELQLLRPDPITGEVSNPLSREQYLDYLIERKVIAQEVKKQGINVDALEVERAIDRKRENLGLSTEDFQRALSQQGMTMDQYREMVREQLINLRLVSQEVRGEIDITEEEIAAFYQQHSDMFTQKDTIHLRHIFIGFDPNVPGAEAKAVAKLEGIRQEVEQGASFAETAKKVSQSPTASLGGDLGWFSLDELLPEFQKQVEGLAVGQMSPVFVQQPGAHLLLVEEAKKGEPRPLAEVHDQIRDQLYQQEAMERYDLWLQRLKARTHIENRLRDQNPSPS